MKIIERPEVKQPRLLQQAQTLGLSLADIADRIGVSPGYVSQAVNGHKQMTVKRLGDLEHLLTMSVCTSCGVETASDVCPNDCRSVHNPDAPKPTIPVRQIPIRCWDCGERIETPPHEREFQGQCDQCTA